jgi:regulation of enolase protein 1 (concanavalin A-like superfamily)
MNRTGFCFVLSLILFAAGVFLPFLLHAAGTITYMERFDERSSPVPWAQRSNNGKLEIKGQGYTIAKSGETEGTVFTTLDFPADLTKDFQMESSVTFLDGAENLGYGIVWGATQDARSLYYFIIDAQGSYGYGKRVNGEEERTVEWTESPFIEKGGTNLLHVGKTGNKMDFYINGQPLMSVPFGPPFGKFTGLCVAHGLAVKYNNFLITGSTDIVPDNLSVVIDGNINGEFVWKNARDYKAFTAKVFNNGSIVANRAFDADSVSVRTRISVPGESASSSCGVYLQTGEGALLKLEWNKTPKGPVARFSVSGQGKDLGSKELPLSAKEFTFKFTRNKDTFKGEVETDGKLVEVGSLNWPKLSARQWVGISCFRPESGGDKAKPVEYSFTDYYIGKP